MRTIKGFWFLLAIILFVLVTFGTVSVPMAAGPQQPVVYSVLQVLDGVDSGRATLMPIFNGAAAGDEKLAAPVAANDARLAQYIALHKAY